LPPDFHELLRVAGASGSACTWCLPSGPEKETTWNIVEVATALKAGGVAYLGFRRSPVRLRAPCPGLARTEAVMRMGSMLSHRAATQPRPPLQQGCRERSHSSAAPRERGRTLHWAWKVHPTGERSAQRPVAPGADRPEQEIAAVCTWRCTSGIRVVSCTAGAVMEAGASLERCSLGTNQAAVVPCWRSCSAW